MNKRIELRQQMRNQRRTLDPAEREYCAIRLAEHIAASALFRNSQHIAFYLSNDGEVDLWPLLEHAWQRDKTCYLPVLGLRHSCRLWFIPYHSNDELIPNQFGILEPQHRRSERLRKAISLDLILAPLVAFDAKGNRLGMGGGYYDRTLGFLRQRRYWRKPRLLGTAYAFQRTSHQLPVQPWDVPLDAIATEQGIEKF